MIRYRTGDRARWPTAADTALLESDTRAALERQPFPVLAILGRDRDRIDALACGPLQGAALPRPRARGALVRRLCGDKGGRLFETRCTQSSFRRDTTGVATALAELIGESAWRRSAPPPQVHCFAHLAFPHGMGLDYERKFRYSPLPETSGYRLAPALRRAGMEPPLGVCPASKVDVPLPADVLSR